MTPTEFLTLIGAPWAAYHDHPDEDTARDAAYIRSRRRAEHGYTDITCVFGCDYPGKDGEAQRARRDLIAAAPRLYAYVASMAATGDTEAKMILREIHGN